MDNNIIGSYILEGATTVEDAIITGGDNRRVIATGTLQDSDTENRNHRIYAKADLFPEVTGPRIKELLKAHEMYGECGHPLSDDLVRQQTIDPKLKCVEYLKIWTEGNLVKANFRGTNNDYGATFDMDLRDGHKPAFSLRALGSIENKSGKAYVKGIKIITWDHVVYPSHEKAYASGLLNESTTVDSGRQLLNENQIVVPKDDPGTIITIRNSDAMNALNKLQRESANVTTILETFDAIYDKISLINENQLLLTSRFGDKISVNLERYVSNCILNYAFKM